MAVIGGTVSSAQQYAIADPWTNGIGIFDLSDMEWKDSYDANAGPYITPEFVKVHNIQNPYPDKWSDPVVESWFTQKGAYTFHSTIEYRLLIELIGEQHSKISPLHRLPLMVHTPTQGDRT